MLLTEKRLRKIIRESLNRLITEGYLDNVYSSENFQRWFKGSKIVDENGRPRLLGHATRSFGFSKFNTGFIHLAPIDDASYFSGGNKRMFKYKNTIDKLSPDEIVKLYNDNFVYDKSKSYVFLTDENFQKIITEYKRRIEECKDPKYIERMKKFGLSVEVRITTLQTALNALSNKIKRYPNKLLFKVYNNGLPRLSPTGFDHDKKSFELWLKDSFPTISSLKRDMLHHMFDKDEYMGKGGTYALCAKIVNPLHIDCKGNSWDRISVTPQNCNGYSELFKKYCEHGYNTSGWHEGSWISMDNESIAILAKQCGYDGVVFHNIREGGLGNIRMNETYIVFSTSQLKSPFENNGDFGDVEHMFR